MNSNALLEAALGYAANGFPVFPLNGKRPALANVGAKYSAATTDPYRIREWWGGLYANCNIGIPAGPKSGFWVLDLDSKADANGVNSLNEIVARHGRLPDTAVQITGSGRHLLFRWSERGIRNSTGKVGPGIDTRGDGGYIVASPSVHPENKRNYVWSGGRPPLPSEIRDAPSWLEDLAIGIKEENSWVSAEREPPPVGIGASYGEAALRYECARIMQAGNGQQEETLNKSTYSIGQLVGAGIVTHTDAVNQLTTAAYSMQSFNPQKPWSADEIRWKIVRGLADGAKKPRQFEACIPEDDKITGKEERANIPVEILELNQRHAAVMLGGKFAILNEESNPGESFPHITFSSPLDFKNKYGNRRVLIGADYQKLGHAWLNHPDRRQYDEIVFQPNGTTEKFFNLWRGFSVKPIEGNCQLYLDHIRENITGGDDELNDFVLDFMADAVQKPGKKPGVSLVLRGDQGVGKGVFAKHFGRLFDPHYVQINNSHHLLGNFNAILQDKLVVFADEAFWAGDKQAEGVLKGLVTEEMNVIEQKGKDAYKIRNYIRLIVASNNEWVVPAGPSERRFCVLDVLSARKQDHSYFSAIEEQMDNGGLEALMHFLMNRNLTGKNLRNLPKTTALQEQKNSLNGRN